MGDENQFAERITQQGSFHLDIVPAEAFKLFTAAGERLWVPGWAPDILGRIPQSEGLVFTTGDGADHTIWTVIDCDVAKGRVRYSRVTPGSRAGIVIVQLAEAGEGSLVNVSYDLTALSPEGAASLQSYAPDQFAQMMIDWKHLIQSLSIDMRSSLANLIV